MSGHPYQRIIGEANNQNVLVKKNYNTADIMALILKALPVSVAQTKELAERLRGTTQDQTLRNVYRFLKSINYKIDDANYQFVPTPQRVLADNKTDCKGLSILTHGLLTNLGIPHAVRFARYTNSGNPKEYTHVYTIVPTTPGKYITIDAVNSGFNQEYGNWSGAPKDFYFDANGAAIGNIIDDIAAKKNQALNYLKEQAAKAEAAAKAVRDAAAKAAQDAADSIKAKANQFGNWTKEQIDNLQTVSLAPARGLISVLVKSNIDGWATRLAARPQAEVKAWWQNMGGNSTTLFSEILQGQNKPAKSIGLFSKLKDIFDGKAISGKPYIAGDFTDAEKASILSISTLAVSALGSVVPGAGTALGGLTGASLAAAIIKNHDFFKGLANNLTGQKEPTPGDGNNQQQFEEEETKKDNTTLYLGLGAGLLLLVGLSPKIQKAIGI
jgi:hypothetical protein